MATFIGIASLVAAFPLNSLAQLTAPAKTGELGHEVLEAMKRATDYYRTKVARHGGYVYYTSEDLSERWGEGKATPDQIWVQPPGTPTVGMAYLAAYDATRDPAFLGAAWEAAQALVKGQLESGGWTNSIDFAASGRNAARYRKLPGGMRNHSSLDDGISQNALRFLMRLDRAQDERDEVIHEAVQYGLEALLKAQLPNGGFPQGWSGPAADHPVVKASYPEYDWRTENRIKNYWDLPTLNDDLATHLIATLDEAWRTYRDERFKDAIERFGEFLLLAQMPDPQPAWAQQYDHAMRPVWARKFEPPAIGGRESQGVLRTLLEIHRITRDEKFLEPIPSALGYLQRSLLPDGKLARYYELKTNRPLYMTRDYTLTYDDSDVPRHYGWKSAAKLEAIKARYDAQRQGKFAEPNRAKGVSEEKVRAILAELDAEGRWVSVESGDALTGQPKFGAGMRFLSSEVFSRNLEILSAYFASER